MRGPASGEVNGPPDTSQVKGELQCPPSSPNPQVGRKSPYTSRVSHVNKRCLIVLLTCESSVCR